jgi:hypothetical protein
MEMTTEELTARDERALAELWNMLDRYGAILADEHLNRDHKIGYIVAACMVDERYHLGWLCNEAAVRLVTEAFHRKGI